MEEDESKSAVKKGEATDRGNKLGTLVLFKCKAST